MNTNTRTVEMAMGIMGAIRDETGESALPCRIESSSCQVEDANALAFGVAVTRSDGVMGWAAVMPWVGLSPPQVTDDPLVVVEVRDALALPLVPPYRLSEDL